MARKGDPCETGRMKVIAVIPARLASTRMPRKMLREIAGVPLLAWVYRGVQRCSSVAEVIVATDSDEILRFCEQQGFVARMTSAAHRSGTERVHEISTAIPADVYLNVQGEVDINNPSAVKVVTDDSGRALYFSRATIPYDRDGLHPRYYKHLGFYGYRKDALDKFVGWPESSLERSERLEQLRFLENGVPIYVAETPFDTVGVDTEEDLRRVEGILRDAAH
jgi:3-deoxy-manno-octulosonate cytidylyltransferase (CMP-KDO synthetase)